MSHWHLERSFWWGVLLVLDSHTSEVPTVTESVVSQSAEGVAVQVLHAQDVDLSDSAQEDFASPAVVTVDITIGGASSDDSQFRGTIHVPSGALTVGDPEEELTLQLSPGRWSIQVDYAPHEHADRVQIWLQPAIA